MASLEPRLKPIGSKWTYGQLIDRLIDLGFERKQNKLNCVALKHSSGAVLLLPKTARNLGVNHIHRTMAEIALSTYHIGKLEPSKEEIRRTKKIEKIANELEEIRNVLTSLGMSKHARKLAEVRDQLQSA